VIPCVGFSGVVRGKKRSTWSQPLIYQYILQTAAYLHEPLGLEYRGLHRPLLPTRTTVNDWRADGAHPLYSGLARFKSGIPIALPISILRT
jgi:hypothetical protein